MAASSLHVSDQYPRILGEFNTILDLHPEDGDNLCVSEGSLHINRGGFLQGPTRTYYDLIGSGYNYRDVVTHLEGLKSANVEFLQGLNLTATSLVDLKTFQRKIHQVAIKMSDLNSALRGVIPADVNRRISWLFYAFKSQSDAVKAFIKQNKPEGWQAPPVVLNLDEPVRYRKLILEIPTGASVSDILRLAETAEAQATTPASDFGIEALTFG